MLSLSGSNFNDCEKGVQRRKYVTANCITDTKILRVDICCSHHLKKENQLYIVTFNQQLK